MRTRTITATAATLLLATLTACGSSGTDTKPDAAACKAVLAKQLDKAIAAGDNAEKGTRPKECNGVDDKTLQRITSELMSGALGGIGATPTPEPTPDQLSDACRAWLKKELLDTTGSIDATAGYSVCGDLSDAEMDQAIKDVTNELTAAP